MWVASDDHPIHSEHPEFDQLKSEDEYTHLFDKAGEYTFHNHFVSEDEGVVTVL